MRKLNWWGLGGLALLLVLAAVLRVGSLRFDYQHPDEDISVKVAGRVVDTGSLDTNWKNADLPPWFKQPQYNFSAYLLTNAAVLQVREWWPGATKTAEIRWLRAWSAWLGVLVVVLTYFVGRLFFGAATGAGAALLVGFFPLLYQDGLYARPETFVTALTLAVAGLTAAPRPLFRGAYVVSAFLLGVLIATKVSLLLLLPLLVLALVPPKPLQDLASWGPPARPSWTQVWQRGKWLPVAVLLGFAAGAPHVFANMEDYVEGIEYLRRQYTSGHWPHGLAKASVLERVDYAGRYFLTTSGWVMLLAFVGAGFAAVRLHLRQLLVFAIGFATTLQFATYSTFLERNLSHVIPLLMIFAAYGVVSLCGAATRVPVARTVLTGAALALVLLPSLRTTAALRFDELPGKPEKRLNALRAGLERQFGTSSIRVKWTPWSAEVREAMANRCDGPMLVELRVPNDSRSEQLIQELVQHDGLREVGRLRSNFAAVPVSTLHTYFRPTTVFLHRPPGLARCLTRDDAYVGGEALGPALRVISVDAEPAWTPAGTPEPEKDKRGVAHFFGSWSGSDASTGRFRSVVSVEGVEHFVLPVLVGPSIERQSFRVSDAATGKTILDSTPRRVVGWQFKLVRVPPGTRTVVLEAADEGSGWGQWHALGVPQALKPD